VFSSDSSSSSLCDFAASDTEGLNTTEELDVKAVAMSINVDDCHSTPVPMATVIQVTIEDQEEEDDPFSEKQVRTPDDKPTEYRQSPVSSNAFIVHVYENANPNSCYRYRAGRHDREALFADLLSMPTIFEEEEALEVHVQASASHDSLLAIDSDTREYERVSPSNTSTVGTCANPVPVFYPRRRSCDLWNRFCG
jgi:hypothetical protein